MEEHRGRTVAVTVAVTSLYPCSTQMTPNKSDIGYHLSSVWSWGEKLKPTVNCIYHAMCKRTFYQTFCLLFTSHFVPFYQPLPAGLQRILVLSKVSSWYFTFSLDIVLNYTVQHYILKAKLFHFCIREDPDLFGPPKKWSRETYNS